MSASTPLLFSLIPRRLSPLSEPAPGRSRSIRYFGMVITSRFGLGSGMARIDGSAEPDVHRLLRAGAGRKREGEVVQPPAVGAGEGPRATGDGESFRPEVRHRAGDRIQLERDVSGDDVDRIAR